MYLYGLAICIVLIGVWALINQYEIWALARFGKMLALPITMVWASSSNRSMLLSRRGRIITAGGAIVLLASQFVYAWYMVRVYYA